MDGAELYLSKKYNAEFVSIDFKTTRTETNGKLTENREYLSVLILNSKFLNDSRDNEDIFNKELREIGQFVMDSINFDTIPFRPKELQIDISSKSGSWIFGRNYTETTTFNLNDRSK